jgi:3-hydroxyacyl-CoA dehydrogenase/enoyl-CoA hydratase/3-hydroxybutyryl-CoA epimerase
MEAAQPVGHWRADRDPAGLCWLRFERRDGPNVLSREVLEELETVLESLAREPPQGLVIWSGKPGTFIAGADIREFPAIGTEDEAYRLVRRGQAILSRLETLPCPSVAVVNGHALGGGLELAMACTWRLALPVDAPSMGLPEVQLGLHPGFGGTVRLVALLGVRRAMDLMLTGRSVTVEDARGMGLIDEVARAEDWRERAADLLRRPRPRRQPPLVDRIASLAPLRAMLARSMAGKVRRRALPEHYPAPYAMIDLWQAHAARGAGAYEAEARSFARLAVTPTSRNLVRVFFLQDRLKRAAGDARSQVRRVHVVGAGIMGGDIAAWCVLQGIEVTLQDREMKYIEPALSRAAKLFAKRLRGPAAQEAARSRLSADVEGKGAGTADIVIEAIFENLDAKQNLYRQLEPKLMPGAVLASNTSSIPLEDLGACLRDPSRLIGLHFFNPVAKLPLVEVVNTERTSAETRAKGAAFARQIAKLPLPCRSQPGFLVNRILAPYLAESLDLARENVPLAEIDQAAVAFGMPMGPIELADSVGLDIALHVARMLAPLLGREVAPELEALVAGGHLGRKSGRGFYVYQEGRPVRPPTAGQAVRTDVQDRLIYALLNEAARCLDENIVADADLVDSGVILGTGFAPFRGGPLHYAQELGTDRVVARLRELADKLGPRFRPSAGWARLGARM